MAFRKYTTEEIARWLEKALGYEEGELDESYVADLVEQDKQMERKQKGEPDATPRR